MEKHLTRAVWNTIGYLEYNKAKTKRKKEMKRQPEQIQGQEMAKEVS
jgi:hypothetical protein